MSRGLFPAVAAAALLAGCGGGRSEAEQVPARFVAAVDAGRRAEWCPQFVPALGQPRERALIRACERRNLFELLGACDRGAAIARTTVAEASEQGGRIHARLSSGLELTFARRHGRWVVVELAGRARPRPGALRAVCG